MSEFRLLQQKIDSFCKERDWDQFHGFKDLAIGAVTEASELLELFRFQSDSDVLKKMQDPDFRKKTADELADVLFFLLRFSSRAEIDLAAAFEAKMKRNAERYPVAQFKGKNHKSTI